MVDLSQRKAAEEEIRYLAFYDPLTRLPNRRLLMDRLQQALATSARHQRSGALLLLDLDNFKTLNETQGHDRGDTLLLQVSHRLRACVHEDDTVARQGGDEFVVVLEDLGDTREEAAARAEEGRAEKFCWHCASPTRWMAKRTTARSAWASPSSAVCVRRWMSCSNGRIWPCTRPSPLAGIPCAFTIPQMQAAVSERAALELDMRQAWRKGSLSCTTSPRWTTAALPAPRPFALAASARWLCVARPVHPAGGGVGLDPAHR